MKFAGKAFVAGFAGWLGAATAIGVTLVVVGYTVEKQLKRVVVKLESELRNATNEMTNGEL